MELKSKAKRMYQWQQIFFVLAILIIFLSPIINNFLTPRVFSQDFEMDNSDNKLAFIVRNFLTGTFLILSYPLILKALKQKLPKDILLLWISVMLFSFGPIISAFFGSKPAFTPQILVIPFGFTILLLLKDKDFEWYVGIAKNVSLLYIYGSLLTALIFPNFSIEKYYSQGLFFSFRLHGIASLANQLAPITILFWICDRLLPSKNIFVRGINWTASLIVLVLTQSKTTWISAIIILILTVFIFLPQCYRILLIFFGSSLFSIILLFFVNINVTLDLGRFLTSDEQNFITTLSGRNLVWSYTIESWKQNPIFGYGLDLWRGEFRQKFYFLYGWAPGQAHSQFFQTLGQSGVLGVTGLLVYIVALFFLSVKYFIKSNGGTLALFTLIIIRSFTESALAGNMFVDSFIIHFFLFGLMVLLIKREKHPKLTSV